MPHSDLHKKKRKKNYIVLAMIIGFIALVWAVTMVRIANASEYEVAELTLPNAFKTQRADHAEAIDEAYESFQPMRDEAATRQIGENNFQDQRAAHLKALYDEDKSW
jgi:hypothetical protein